MSLSQEEVEKLAWLARLAIGPEEVDEVIGDLSRIVEFVRQLQAVPTESVDPMAHPLDTTQRLREDAVTETDCRDEFQRNAPLAEKGLYLVPRVIE